MMKITYAGGNGAGEASHLAAQPFVQGGARQ
jgi:hypothetical protein